MGPQHGSFVRDNCRPLEEGLTPTVTVIQTPTNLQLADGLTKALTKDLFKVFQDAVTARPLCLAAKEALFACTSSPVRRGGSACSSHEDIIRRRRCGSVERRDGVSPRRVPPCEWTSVCQARRGNTPPMVHAKG